MISALSDCNCLGNKPWSNLRKAGQNYSCLWKVTLVPSFDMWKLIRISLTLHWNDLFLKHMAEIRIIMPYLGWYIDQSLSFALSSWKKHEDLKAYLKVLLHPLSFSCGDQAHTAQIDSLTKDRKANPIPPSSCSGLKKTAEVTDEVNLLPVFPQV